MSRLGLTARVDNQKQVVNVNPINNISVSVRSPSEIQEHKDESDVHYPPEETDVKDLLNTIQELTSQNEALKIIISMYKENPIYVNSLLLVDDEKLAALIKLLTNSDEVAIDAEDIGSGCSAKTYRKVNAIYIIKDGNTKNLKYDYPDITKLLKELGINIKVVW